MASGRYNLENACAYGSNDSISISESHLREFHMIDFRLTLAVCLILTCHARAEWIEVYSESFDRLAPGTKTASSALSNWEANSASGVVFDGQSKPAGRFLVASSAWTSFNQGPIFNVDLTGTPHDRVRVHFDLYTFGDWRGLQRSTGGPQHRLMFFDSKATPRFSFDTNFSTNAEFRQSWPKRNPAQQKALTGATAVDADESGRFRNAHRWPIEFEYPSDSPALRFTMLCGAAAGSGQRMPHFGIDNVRVLVQSTAPVINPVDRPEDIRLASATQQTSPREKVDFEIDTKGRTSLAIFDRSSGRLIRTLLRGEALASGRHTVFWDGLDDRARPVAPGSYEWRLVTTPGLSARYVTTIGINPPGGEHPQPRMSWVGDHNGAGIVDVDSSGVYIGSPITEGMLMIAKADPQMSGISWRRSQFYEGGRLTRLATSGEHVFMLHPTGKLRRLNKGNGRVEATWNVAVEGKPPGDVDAQGKNLVVVDGEAGTVRWLSASSGKTLATVKLPEPGSVAVMESREKGAAFVSTERNVYRVEPSATPNKLATLNGVVNAMDYDLGRDELWAVVNGHRVVRLNAAGKVTQTYSETPRPMGLFDPTRFAGVYDIAADLNGGFYIGEPGQAPRRIAHIARDGSLIDQWFGGMSFYISGTFDPDDPSRLIGIAPEGSVNVYRIDYETGEWDIEACYATGRLGDSLFPFSGVFRAVRRNGELYLYHRVVPAVLRLDAKHRKAVPVAIAGRVLNRGRTLVQFAGTGRDGYPRPWVAAAEHHGFSGLAKAPKLYSWADTDGDGDFDVSEFRFYPQAKRGLSFHNPGDYTSNGDYIGSTGVNEPHALVRLPVAQWEGPDKATPRWDWNRAEAVGEITANSYGYGSPRGVSVAPNDSVSVAYQAGIMIRAHGQYEGGGWPESALRGARVLGFDAKLNPKFSIGRQSKDAAEANTGVFYYPMQTTSGPHGSVIVNDQTKQPAQVWTHDGLYVGGVFDNRADDERDDGFYRLHGDDNQGATIVTAENGRTYWLMPYVGHNRLYEISGWNNWSRQSGRVSRPQPVPDASKEGTGLTARYYKGNRLVLETVEDPIYYERFGAERHTKEVTPHYKATWTGFVNPPVTDRFQFRTLLGKAEQCAVWIDGKVVYASGLKRDINNNFDLTAGRRHRIHIEYINPDGRAELTLLWSGRTTDLGRLPLNCLYPEQ